MENKKEEKKKQNTEKNTSKSSVFEIFASKVSKATGSTASFTIALTVVSIQVIV